jgi:hypothetical protein
VHAAACYVLTFSRCLSRLSNCQPCESSHVLYPSFAICTYTAHAHSTQHTDVRAVCSHTPTCLRTTLAPAVNACLQPAANVLQDTLRLLTLWFAHGGDARVHAEVAAGLEGASVDTWLAVVPQLIARVHVRTPRVAALLLQLLTRIGREHPQAVSRTISKQPATT